MAPPPRLSFEELAAKLATDGPVKQEPAKRRVRGLLDGRWIFDTLDAVFVWEHPYFPFFYVPFNAVSSSLADNGAAYQDAANGYHLFSLRVSSKTVMAVHFLRGPLQGLVKIPYGELDAWYVEDEKLLGSHPKDPYKRIECLPSSRRVVVRMKSNEAILASSTNNVFLHETGLPARYYLSPTSIISLDCLVPSETKTMCPYKGEARYYHLQVGNQRIEDAIWYYPYPTAESMAIQNRLCFYDDKVDIRIEST
ncbi:DUF427-domain-containing protein [Echria macrotheca]|uniref:DUF427-domain-containing protein n=1 Tax=Echria macrotheca TaxID=438768 RepID=A0AAJ0BIW7_9PEZI|nr:DUF427-domain-containing protein [Echria macrotheca]